MPSFDTVCEADMVQVRNGVDNASKEINTRFDFKGSCAAVELKDKEIELLGEAEFQLVQIEDILRAKLSKRGLDLRFLERGEPQKIGGDKLKLVLRLRHGVPADAAKKITRLLKDSKLKVQGAIQGAAVRVSGAKRDDLQAAMALIRKDLPDLPLSFNNLRD